MRVRWSIDDGVDHTLETLTVSKIGKPLNEEGWFRGEPFDSIKEPMNVVGFHPGPERYAKGLHWPHQKCKVNRLGKAVPMLQAGKATG